MFKFDFLFILQFFTGAHLKLLPKKAEYKFNNVVSYNKAYKKWAKKN